MVWPVVVAVLVVFGSFVAYTLLTFRSQFRKALAPVHEKSNIPTIQRKDPRQRGALYLYIPDLRPWGYPNASPYSSKLETWLRMAEIPFTVIRGMDLQHAPKGKVPYIELDGKLMGDSQLIIEYLSKKWPNCKCTDAHLTPEEKAISLAFIRLSCESLVASMGYSRNYENMEKTLNAYAGNAKIPWLPRKIISYVITSSTLKRLKAQGIGAHSRDEIYEIGNRNLQAISDFLGSKKFFMGDEPSQVDASMFGILSSILWIPVEFPCKEYAYKQCPNLHFYLLRIKQRFYSDTIEPWYTGGLLAEELTKSQDAR